MAVGQVKLPINLINGPDVLAEAVKAVANNWNPAATRREYAANKETWELYLKLLELDETSLATLVDQHGDDATELPDKFEARQRMAVVFNLVPTIVNMFTGYIFSEEPVLDLKGDPDLEAFAADCTGGGMKLTDWLRLKALPYAIGMGWIDTLVQNPATDGDVVTVAQAEDGRVTPAVFPITPLHRVNWSAHPNGSYNWISFRDFGTESPDPFIGNPVTDDGYITVSAARAGLQEPGGKPAGFWVRSNLGSRNDVAAGGLANQTVWNIECGFTPTIRCSVATLFYKESLDPAKKHFGVSKLGTIALLTRAIVNVLSWTTEDILANLALIAIPSKGGKAPVGEDGNPAVPTLSPTTLLWFDPTATGGKPEMLHGDVGHIKVKLEYVQSLVTEILRQANLLGVSGDVKTVTSGVQGWVMRSELFQELSTMATAMDNYTIDLLALAKSWATGEDWTRERLLEEIDPTINFHKGPYAIDPLEVVIKNATEVVSLFKQVSPKMAEAALAYVARSFLFADDPDLPEVLEEIKKNTGGVLQTFADNAALLASDIAASAAGGVPNELQADAKSPA